MASHAGLDVPIDLRMERLIGDVRRGLSSPQIQKLVEFYCGYKPMIIRVELHGRLDDLEPTQQPGAGVSETVRNLARQNFRGAIIDLEFDDREQGHVYALTRDGAHFHLFDTSRTHGPDPYAQRLESFLPVSLVIDRFPIENKEEWLCAAYTAERLIYGNIFPRFLDHLEDLRKAHPGTSRQESITLAIANRMKRAGMEPNSYPVPPPPDRPVESAAHREYLDMLKQQMKDREGKGRWQARHNRRGGVRPPPNEITLGRVQQLVEHITNIKFKIADIDNGEFQGTKRLELINILRQPNFRGLICRVASHGTCVTKDDTGRYNYFNSAGDPTKGEYVNDAEYEFVRYLEDNFQCKVSSFHPQDEWPVCGYYIAYRLVNYARSNPSFKYVFDREKGNMSNDEFITNWYDAQRLAGRGRIGGNRRRGGYGNHQATVNSTWVNFVRAFARENHLSWFDALVQGSPVYRSLKSLGDTRLRDSNVSYVPGQRRVLPKIIVNQRGQPYANQLQHFPEARRLRKESERAHDQYEEEMAREAERQYRDIEARIQRKKPKPRPKPPIKPTIVKPTLAQQSVPLPARQSVQDGLDRFYAEYLDLASRPSLKKDTDKYDRRKYLAKKFQALRKAQYPLFKENNVKMGIKPF